MNKLLIKLTLLIIGIYLAAHIQTTSAGFVDSENTTGNSQKSGSVDLVLSNNLSPVDTKIAGEMKFINDGTIPFVYDQSYKVSGSNCGDKDIKITKDSTSIYSGSLLGLDGFSYLETNEIKHDEEDVYIVDITPQNTNPLDLNECVISIESNAWQKGLGKSVGFSDNETTMITDIVNPLGINNFATNIPPQVDADLETVQLEITLTPTPTPLPTPTDSECSIDCPVDTQLTPTPTIEPTSTPELSPTPVTP